MLAAALALAASVSWGAGDFLGGLKSRTLPVLSVLAVSQPVGLVGVAVAALLFGGDVPGGEIAWACVAAIFGTCGLAAFYRGMASGAISIVAPIAGAAAIVPVVVGLARGDHPGTLQELGFAVVLGGVVLASAEPRGRRRVAAGAGWALAAAIGFGGFYVPMHAASQHGFLWAALLFRATSSTLVLTAWLILRPSLRGAREQLPAVAAIGVFDTGANVLFGAAAARGLVSTVSVLSSLYPVVTVVLARVTLGERVHRSQELGIALTLVGVVLVSSG